jgi:hypothetical protein
MSNALQKLQSKLIKIHIVDAIQARDVPSPANTVDRAKILKSAQTAFKTFSTEELNRIEQHDFLQPGISCR